MAVIEWNRENWKEGNDREMSFFHMMVIHSFHIIFITHSLLRGCENNHWLNVKDFIRNNIRMRGWIKGDGCGDNVVWMVCFEICGQIPHSTFNNNTIIPIPSSVVCLNSLPNDLNLINWNRFDVIMKDKTEMGMDGMWNWRFGERSFWDWWIFHCFICVLTNPHFVEMCMNTHQNKENVCVRLNDDGGVMWKKMIWGDEFGEMVNEWMNDGDWDVCLLFDDKRVWW